jgi:arylsulfatase A-like enzyme
MSTTGKANILLIIADDLGADSVLVTDRSPERRMFVITDAGGPMILGQLPYLSILLRNGLYFDQAWAQPVCSPTRGSIYTGTWPWRNGVGWPSSPRLDPASVTALPLMLAPEGYQCGLFGKWHLGDTSGFWPTDHGWNRHIGTLGGVINPAYDNWPRRDSDTGYAAVPNSSVYATQQTVDDAGSWISTASVGNTPWFATIAFHSPHDPFHEPPADFLLPGGIVPATDDDMFNAMAQNMDAHIGRLLGSGVAPAMTAIATAELENTVILFLGDNGSPSAIATEEPKTTIYEGGVHVPMIVADGTSVAAEISGATATPRFLSRRKLGRSSPHMVHAVDLYETITEIAGVTAALPSPMDSVSLWEYPSRARNQPPAREINFSQYYTGGAQNGEKGATIRNLDYKLNCERVVSAGVATWSWAFFAFQGHEVPGLEDGNAEDVFLTARDDLRAGVANAASDNFDALVEELINSGSYAIDDLGTVWDDPR